MNERKNRIVILGFVFSVSLIASSLSVLLASRHESLLRFNLFHTFCSEILAQEPEAEPVISAALKKAVVENTASNAGEELLSGLGYRISDFSHPNGGHTASFAAAGCLAGSLLFLLTFFYRNEMEARRIRALAEYLEQVPSGRAAVLSASGEDDFSKLEDAIYKTVTHLYQTKDAAVQAKNDFADNLSNIAHQIKTPITAMSLSVQMMKQSPADSPSAGPANKTAVPAALHAADPDGFRHHLEQLEKQLIRLTRLEEALLLLSRIDAGTLLLRQEETDVFTLLVLAAENLQELFAGSEASVEIPEFGEIRIFADLDWTMEAVMNLMKNCMEHSPGGTVHCSCAQNPLYTEILIWDEGKGFAKEDLPHLFERFYRGQNAGEGGIGIGLALAKEILERQNGTLRAKNKAGGGALFEIRFYSH